MTTEQDSLESLIKHYKLQPWQENLLRLFMEEPEVPIQLRMRGRQCGKSHLAGVMLEYMKQIGNETKKQQDPSETN
jgi:translation initiation factor IF-3